MTVNPSPHETDPVKNRSALPKEYRSLELQDFLDKSRLTSKEKKISTMLMNKYFQKEIAEKLGISQQAVAKNIIAIKQKLGLERTLKILSD